jgi:hypothetical protein
MTTVIEILISTPTGIDRVIHTFAIPAGATVKGLLNTHNEARLIVRGDPGRATTSRSFSVLRAGVELSAQEVSGTYVGSFNGLRPAAGQEFWHVFAL